MRGLFVSGTDTGVGKTVLSAALLAAMAAQGERVCAHKPVLTGLEQPAADWPTDDVLLASVSGMNPQQVVPLRLQAAAAPHLAAALEGLEIDPAALLERARLCLAGDQTAVVEGVGGLLVPLTDSYTVADFAAELALPMLIAARPGLGTINHTLLTLSVARQRGIAVRAVVLTPWPAQPSRLELSNRQTISRLGEIEVAALPGLSGPDPLRLAAAGAQLPWRRWLES